MLVEPERLTSRKGKDMSRCIYLLIYFLVLYYLMKITNVQTGQELMFASEVQGCIEDWFQTLHNAGAKAVSTVPFLPRNGLRSSMKARHSFNLRSLPLTIAIPNSNKSSGVTSQRSTTSSSVASSPGIIEKVILNDKRTLFDTLLITGLLLSNIILICLHWMRW